MTPIPFAKYHGIGNDFVIVEAAAIAGLDRPGLARAICNRTHGVGADGLILVQCDPAGPVRMEMLNPDGSVSEMCGNGLRCFADYCAWHGIIPTGQSTIETGAGPLAVTAGTPAKITVQMGTARLRPSEIGMVSSLGRFIDQPIGEGLRATAVSMGNPHLVIFVDHLESIDLPTLGPKLEHHELFPSRVNVHFVVVNSRTSLSAMTWERGAGATLACGTGACACLVAAVENGLADREAEITLPGGTLALKYQTDGQVIMTGPSQHVFDGTWLPKAAG